MSQSNRSDCPINLAVEVLGDRWTLLVLRDIVVAERAHFRALLEGSREGISPSVLADRLQALVLAGILVREACPTHRQKALFRLTASGADLVPILAQLGRWAARHCCGGAAACGEDLAVPPRGEALADVRARLRDTLAVTAPAAARAAE